MIYLQWIGPRITKESNRQPLSSGQRLEIILRFLATVACQQTLAFQFRVGKSTVCNVLRETCTAVWETLHHQVSEKPSRASWLKISNDFFFEVEFSTLYRCNSW